MCGIAGVVHYDSDRRVDPQLLRRMTDAIRHRGPDGEGFYHEEGVGLGHRRLAVIDLATGDQPMYSRDRNLIVVFNGEIYNYLELKEELKALGHVFQTTSDTEVILAAYEQWGCDCQKKFNGMWAFALWDKKRSRLLLSRDRLGEKPLYYSARGKSFFFGSEIKSILAAGHEYEPALELLHIYLSLGWVPAPFTFYKGISKLRAGHFLIVERGRVAEQVYWDLPAIPEREMRRDASGVYAEFENYFRDSVRIRMRSDVPFGAFLSGGLDSSSVVAAMAEQSRSPVETFTIGFSEKAFDERALAKTAAEAFRTRHFEEVAQPETFDAALQQIVHHFDEPFGDTSAVPVGLVSRLARQRVTMVLTGDGGDEVLSGYTSYLAERFSETYRKVPGSVRSLLCGSAQMAAVLTRSGLRYRANRLKRSLELCGSPFEERFISKLALVDQKSIRALIPPEIPQLTLQEYLSDLFAKCPFKDPFYRLMYYHLKVSLPDDMLAKVDRMSMAHSLETRVPFLDYRLVELGWGVDKRLKMPRFNSKNLLKQTYGQRLPAALLKAPKKPFSVPVREWFKQDGFAERLRELQTAEFGLNGRVISEIVKANNSSKQDYGNFIWRIFVLKSCLQKTGLK